MKNILKNIGTYLLIIIGIILIVIFAVFYFLIQGINWIVLKSSRRRIGKIDKWLDKNFNIYDSEFEE